MHLKSIVSTAAFATIVVVAHCATAAALSMTPMQLELTAAGNGSRAQFVITNDSDKPLPFEVIYEQLSYSESGERHVSKASDDLAVFPITAMIPAGGSQTFRVQWVGSPDLRASQSFMITARQLPLKLKGEARAAVQLVVAFGAILNVAPLSGKADLKLVSSTQTTNHGKPALSIVVENPTNVHALIYNCVLRTGAQTVNQDTMRNVVGIGVVGPLKRRRFLVPLTNGATGPVSLEYRPLAP